MVGHSLWKVVGSNPEASFGSFSQNMHPGEIADGQLVTCVMNQDLIILCRRRTAAGDLLFLSILVIEVKM